MSNFENYFFLIVHTQNSKGCVSLKKYPGKEYTIEVKENNRIAKICVIMKILGNPSLSAIVFMITVHKLRKNLSM